MAALLFGKALLRAIARPRVMDHPRAEPRGDGRRAVGRARNRRRTTSSLRSRTARIASPMRSASSCAMMKTESGSGAAAVIGDLRICGRSGPASSSATFRRSEGWCPGAESNHRHCDFQSHALPTELPGHPASPQVAARRSGCIGARPAPVQREPRTFKAFRRLPFPRPRRPAPHRRRRASAAGRRRRSVPSRTGARPAPPACRRPGSGLRRRCSQSAGPA